MNTSPDRHPDPRKYGRISLRIGAAPGSVHDALGRAVPALQRPSTGDVRGQRRGPRCRRRRRRSAGRGRTRRSRGCSSAPRTTRSGSAPVRAGVVDGGVEVGDGAQRPSRRRGPARRPCAGRAAAAGPPSSTARTSSPVTAGSPTASRSAAATWAGATVRPRRTPSPAAGARLRTRPAACAAGRRARRARRRLSAAEQPPLVGQVRGDDALEQLPPARGQADERVARRLRVRAAVDQPLARPAGPCAR